MKMVEFWPQKKMELMNDRKKLNERKQRGNKKKENYTRIVRHGETTKSRV